MAMINGSCSVFVGGIAADAKIFMSIDMILHG